MLSVLGTLLAVACASDAALHRIPNAIAVGLAMTGLLGQGLAGGGLAVANGAAGVMVVAIVVWPAWARGLVGGGDLKLGAATAAWLGIRLVPHYLLLSAAAVGLVSVICYAASAQMARSEMRRNLAMAARGASFSAPLGAHHGRVQVPAGVGFAIGALATLAVKGGL